MSSAKGKDAAKARDHISARRLREVAEEHSTLNMPELEHLSRCALCVDYFVELIRLAVEKKLKAG